MMRPQHAVSLISVGPSLTDISYCYVDGIMYKMSPLNYQKKRPYLNQKKHIESVQQKNLPVHQLKTRFLKYKLKVLRVVLFIGQTKNNAFFPHSAAVAFMISISFFKTQNFSWRACKGLPGYPTRWAPNFRTDRYKWNLWGPYKWPYTWVTGVISPLSMEFSPYLRLVVTGPTL